MELKVNFCCDVMTEVDYKTIEFIIKDWISFSALFGTLWSSALIHHKLASWDPLSYFSNVFSAQFY